MIISVNPKPQLEDFKKLMSKTDKLLNEDAKNRHDYYLTRGGKLLEDDVKAALEECAIGTPFENTIEKISGQRFPDIIAAKFYGIEVKSTTKDHWTSTGSSILETTRVTDVERIFMTFGKLGGNPIEFLSKPYEECLYGIAVTHMPRYLINMQLNEGETIFDKMGISYDKLRVLDNPIKPVADYYRGQLRPGERLWWVGDTEDETVSPTIRLWKNVSLSERTKMKTYALVYYPEVFVGDYDRYALWLSAQGVVDTHIRDQFSSGGKEKVLLSSGERIDFPGVYRRLKENMNCFLKTMADKEPKVLLEKYPTKTSDLGRRLLEWSYKVAEMSPMQNNIVIDVLTTMFFGRKISYSGKIVTCSHCKQKYGQKETRQLEGFKERDEDICPYCGKSNGSSMEKEYTNYKI